MSTDFCIHFGIKCYVSGSHTNDCKYDCSLVCDAVQCMLMFYRNLLFESSPDHQMMATAVPCELLVHFCGLLSITQKMFISIVIISISLTVVSYIIMIRSCFFHFLESWLTIQLSFTHIKADLYGLYHSPFLWTWKRQWKCFKMLEHESWLFIY